MPFKPNKMQAGFFLALLVVTSLAFLWVIRGFLLPLFWATVLALIFRPLFEKLARKMKNGFAALLTVMAILLVVVLPVFLVGVAVVSEVDNLYQQVSSGEIDLAATVAYMESRLPILQEFTARVGLDPERIRGTLVGAAASASQVVATRAIDFGQNILSVLVQFFLMLYLLYFFFIDGDRLVERLIRVLPLGDERERRLLTRFADVSRATLKGTLIVAAVQGTIGGITFALLGIQAAVFWGVIMTLLSLLPAIGTALVWVPAAIILFATGHLVKAIILVIVGTLIIGLVDNLLRPILVGRDARMPDYLVLITTLGGITLFGLSGFIIGPVVAALFLTTWNIFAEDFSYLDDPNGTPRIVPPGDAALAEAANSSPDDIVQSRPQ